ncbi:hypothetical protein BWQ96_04483 [Gracilariopsis chorda]|uniref:Uncharacterized protein n=1 Tax=Gracilariopsis chorda TaxID=448386 RepID=A0A2V3IUD1_9FLOR|nr:hypothetical protein BWQ96_04483 [Gracilariopsis chorda]|eukprot:PXF45715.1 hypothetical protein BWQ96_04483 [Gracilariopsis chorda]
MPDISKAFFDVLHHSPSGFMKFMVFGSPSIAAFEKRKGNTAPEYSASPSHAS